MEPAALAELCERVREPSEVLQIANFLCPGNLAVSGHRDTGAPVPGRWHTYPEQGSGASLWTTPEDLARCFQQKLKRLPVQDGRDYTWRYPANNPKRFLNIVPPTARGPHQALKLPRGTKAVVILSRR